MGSVLLKNTVANIIAKIWSIVSLYIFVPLWIRFLGVEGYGVISFYTILMTLMTFADAGLSATLTREFAKVEPTHGYRADLLKTIERIYWGVALLIWIAIYFFAPYIVSAFLKSETISTDNLVGYVRIMAPILSFNFVYMLYSGGLMGLQKQVLSNGLNIGYSMSRGVFVLIFLYFIPTVNMFLYWQLFSIVIVMFLSRICLRHAIGVDKTSVFRPAYLRGVWKYALGMMAMAIIASLNTQLDKLVVGNLLSIKEMGMYSLAGTIGQAVLLVTTPLCLAFYPELTRLVSCGNKEKISESFYLFTFVISSLSSCIGFTLFFYTDEVATLWLSSDIAFTICVPTRILILANIALSLQYSVYYLAIAHGHTKTNVFLGSFMLVFTIPSVFLMTKEHGLMGAAIPYLILNTSGTIYLGIVIMNKFLKSHLKRWLWYTCIPVCVSSIMIGLGYYLVTCFTNNILAIIVCGCSVALVTDIILLYILFRLFPMCLSYRLFNRIYSILPNKFTK